MTLQCHLSPLHVESHHEMTYLPPTGSDLEDEAYTQEGNTE